MTSTPLGEWDRGKGELRVFLKFLNIKNGLRTMESGGYYEGLSEKVSVTRVLNSHHDFRMLSFYFK